MKYLKIFFLLLVFSASVMAQKQNEIILKEGLAIRPSGRMQRSSYSIDPIEAKMIKGDWEIPSEGDSIKYGGGFSKWTKMSVNKDGWFEGQNLRGGYLSIVYDSPVKKKVLLAAFSNSLVYVNGELHFGNRYGSKEQYEAWEPRFDFSLIPVELKKGRNEFLFAAGGRLKAKLIETGDGVFFNFKDSTLPDIIAGEEFEGIGGTVVINNTDKPLKDITIVSTNNKGEKREYRIEGTVIQPMSLRKLPFKVYYGKNSSKGWIELKLEIIANETKNVLASGELRMRIMNKEDNHRVTFVSGIDESVQYYSINPARSDDGKPKALFLSVHGADVEALNQSGSYYPKTWGHIVSPTNRRPYGFDWEDWGRIDAMEVYDIALKTLNINRDRIYLTGHSMGGHGTWQLGALYPDKFAAIGPSAGWISFFTYAVRPGNANPDEMEKMIMRAMGTSDTYALSENYKQEGIYIIHGGADDNVPPSESRNMVENLKKFHKDFVYYEQPGAAHWWDNSDEDGADCVDWPPLFDFFARHALPAKDMVRELSFTTANPEVSSKDQWISIISQNEQLKMSKANFRIDPGKNRFIGTTENVHQLGIDCTVADLKRPILFDIDGQKINYDGSNDNRTSVLFEKKGNEWGIIDKINMAYKNPNRYGTFKSAINHNVVFVYGTRGNKEENEWSFNKARYDAELFWYQGNGSIKVISDKELTASGVKENNYVIYGNAETNAAWNILLKNSPVQVYKGKVKIGAKEYKGKDLACVFVRPIEGSGINSVGVVAGSGIEGMKLTDRRGYLQPGSAFPDLMLLNGEIAEKGVEGILAAGFFGLDWSVDNGEIVYRNMK